MREVLFEVVIKIVELLRAAADLHLSQILKPHARHVREPTIMIETV
jgi:hypothetical protein